MNMMIRNIRSTLGKALLLYASALTLQGATAVAFDPQAPGGGEQRKRDPDALTFTPIDVPGATDTTASGINERGQIVGVYRDAGGVDCPTTGVGCHGFLLDEGAFTPIDVPGTAGTQAGAINRRGQIVGFFIDTTGTFHGFLLDQGTFTRIDVPGATATLATEINDRG
jgi:probable HAF family extracellular repeat protein